MGLCGPGGAQSRSTGQRRGKNGPKESKAPHLQQRIRPGYPVCVVTCKTCIQWPPRSCFQRDCLNQSNKQETHTPKQCQMQSALRKAELPHFLENIKNTFFQSRNFEPNYITDIILNQYFIQNPVELCIQRHKMCHVGPLTQSLSPIYPGKLIQK